MNPLEALLVVQDHDLAADRLRHRRAAVPERAELAAARGRIAELEAGLASLGARRAEVDARERRLGDEVAAVTGRAAEVEKSMYSGEISSPRELQAMHADIEQLRRHQRTLEDRELESMEGREELDAEIARAETAREALRADTDRLGAIVDAQEAEIDEEIRRELGARAALADGLDPDLLATYEDRRLKAAGAGAARLVGMTCQGCHLTVPSTEVDRMRRQAAAPDGIGDLTFCDNCGCILVLV